jgi:hypothetical protein
VIFDRLRFARVIGVWRVCLEGVLLLAALFQGARVDAGEHGSGPLSRPESPPAAPALPPLPLRREREEFAYRPGTAGFPVWIDDNQVYYTVLASSVLPGQRVRVRVSGDSHAGWQVHVSDGVLEVMADTSWVWQAPKEPGICALRIRSSNGLPPVHLNIFVLRPADELKGGYINGFRIGAYPERVFKGREEYRRPQGFIELTGASEDILVSPHFTLGQFRCKQAGDPAYLVLSQPLLRKLETLLEEVNRAGIRALTLAVLSGFRTPSYNASIGNDTEYSRHLWGDAADIYIDSDGDGIMDDLNGDGRISIQDARVLQRIVERLDSQKRDSVRTGGIASYGATAAHGPFVHIDARGFLARW